jgi:uncharacterized Zn-binding protein involved in type VI secretion
MPGRPAARVGDLTAHGSPLSPGPGSFNVLIGKQLAWRGLGASAVAKLLEEVAKVAVTATSVLAVQTPANVKELVDGIEKVVQIMGSVDQHACPIVKVVVPDGNGVVIDGSQTVLINGLPACRLGDTVQEATSVNKIVMGEMTVLIGG